MRSGWSGLAALAAVSWLAAFTAPALAQTDAQPAPFTAGWRDGFVIQSAGGDVRLQIGLLVQADGRFAIVDHDGTAPDTFLIRRARPNLRGRFGERFEFHLNPDFGGGSAVLQDVYLETIVTRAFRIRVGKWKTPFGLERLHSSAHLLFVERGLPTAVAPNRDIGVQLLGDLRGGTVSYQAAVMNGVADGGSADRDTTDGKDLGGRLIVRPFAARPDTPWRRLGGGVAVTRGRPSGAGALPSFRTASLQQPFFSYSGVSADGVRVRYSPQVFYSYRSAGAFGEYVRSRTPIRRGTLLEDIDHEAWQLAASLMLTGEDVTDGNTAIRPRAGLGQGGWGAVQLAGRYQALTVDDRAVALGFAAPGSSRKVEAWTLGVNWILTPQVRYLFNVERTVFDDGVDGARRPENGFVFRTQLNF
jgi:phosphate-selective porin OprO and OprP